jgi:ABC-type multidrug transport system ATPase subunit
MELKIENLSKTYSNGVQALKNVSLTIPNGMFGLLGPNGAGKSTLMRTIATLQDSDTGTIYFRGIEVKNNKHEIRKVLGYLPQDFGLDPQIEAIELLNHFAILKGISNKAQRKQLVNELLNQTNLWDSRNKRLGGFSGGMKQRFGIAQALIGNPQLLIVDEPTAGLDPGERNRFHNLLSEIGENIVIILSTHIVDDVTDLCKNMAIINKGEVYFNGKPANILNSLHGKIWSKEIDKSEINQYTEKYKILSTRLLDGQMLVRIYSEGSPHVSFSSCEPNLEDAYFYTINAINSDLQ